MHKVISTKVAVGIILGLAVLLGGLSLLLTNEQIRPSEDSHLPQPSKQKVEKKAIENVDAGPTKSLIYQKGTDLVMYNPLSQEKKIVLNSDKLIDYDLSRDEKYLVYSIREDGFEGNADIYLKDLINGQVKKLTEKNNMASINPKIFPDNKKVAYVRRTYNETTKELSDGEIWMIDASGDPKSSKKLLGDDSKPFIDKTKLESEKVMDENGNWTGQYFCIGTEEINSVKIGITAISPNGKEIAYWKSGWAPECSGLWQEPHFSRIDGASLFSQKFKNQNHFDIELYGKKETYDWLPYKIWWFDDEGFMVDNTAMPPLGGEAIYYYDKDQNKKWVIYDSSIEEKNDSFSQAFVTDVKKVSDDAFIIAYQLYFNKYDPNYYSEGKFAGTKYLVKEVKLGDNITNKQLAEGTSFAISEEDRLNIANVQILNRNLIAYNKGDDQSAALYVFDIANRKETKVDMVD